MGSTSKRCRPRARRRGVALIMVLLVLSTLAVIGAPFVISMALQDKASAHFAGSVTARLAAESVRNHAIADLAGSVYGVEYVKEAEELEGERPRIYPRGDKTKRSARRTSSGRKGLVVRRDRNEKVQANRSARNARTDPRKKGASGEVEKGEEPKLPDRLRLSMKGPSERDVDAPDELRAGEVAPVDLPEGVVGPDGEKVFRFQDPSGVMATAVVEDEQAKIHLDTAPPNLIANLFGTGLLAEELKPRATRIVLEDAGMFRGDSDPATIDGAVVIVDAEAGIIEAITYRRKEGDALADCFRGAFLSLIKNHDFPKGTSVYDLRGWKAGYHRLWAEREGGFHPPELTRFPSVEAIRAIADWQIASLFVGRFRGEGLTPEILRRSGIREKDLVELGLDPYLSMETKSADSPEAKKALDKARKDLRRLGFKADLIEKLADSRGPQVVKELAARLAKADRKAAEKVEADLARSLAKDRRSPAKIPPEYLKAALEDLAETYSTPGIETILPEDLERLRGSITVSSRAAVEWSEAQAVLEDVGLAPGATLRIPRASEFNAGTVVRIRSRSDPDHVEFNVAAATGADNGMGGMRLAFPLQVPPRGYDGLIQALQRHPVNANSASRAVLRAVFTGVRGFAVNEVVTPFEADRLAELVIESRPIRGHEGFHKLLEGAVRDKVIDGADLEALMINAVAPTHNRLRVSTTGLSYAAGDVYTIESRGVLRNASGGENARARFLEVVEVAPARKLASGLLTQADMGDGFFFMDPSLGPGFPESHHLGLAGFSGTRSHLVQTRPLLLHRAIYAFPGGDLSTLRLFPSETPETLVDYAVGDPPVWHFRDTYEGLELAHGEPWMLDITLDPNARGPGQVAPTAPQGNAAQQTRMDLLMTPSGIDFWFRMRTFPDARSEDGHLILFDAGTEPERNRISLLYADRMGEVRLRLHDSSLRDPSVIRNQTTGQYLEVTARRALELETWYHLRAVWNGVFGGGAQLFIDGIPSGTDNLSTELVSAIPESGEIPAIAVRDASKLPLEGVVRIDSELFEYRKNGNSLVIRRQPPSTWIPPQTGVAGGRRGGQVEPPEPEGGNRNEAPLPQQGPGGPGGAGGPGGQGQGMQAPPPGSDIMRSPWNRRGYAASAHLPGAKVVLHGYSLEVRRKLRFPGQQGGGGAAERQAQGTEMVWGQGGRRSLERLPTSALPPGAQDLVHLDIDPSWLGGGLTDYIVPFYETSAGGTGQGFANFLFLSATVPGGGTPRNAADAFQSKGVCVLDNTAFIFKKEKLPPAYLQAQRLARWILQPQDTGLRVLGSYTLGGAGDPGAWQKYRNRLDTSPFWWTIASPLTHRSIIADGPIGGFYPPTGILEVRGSPAPWEAGRPNHAGQPAFGHHPDDVVEWIRYAEILDGAVYGEQFHLFVGRTGSNFNFRGYPERYRQGQSDLRKQLEHAPGEPLRLVMELSEGGAGYGDYVTIATSDPAVYEPQMRRVYKVLEHQDGRFFVSLLDVGSGGMDIPSSPGVYQNVYTRAMNPRLVKFPSWGLPEVFTGSAVFFGEALGAGPGSTGGRAPSPGVRSDDEDDTTGISLDEVRLLQDRTIRVNPVQGPQVRFVMVPLDGGSVPKRQLPNGGIVLSGAVEAQRSVSQASPQEVLVVSVSKERGAPSIFARGVNEGLIRIGDELFYFDDPSGAGGANLGAGTRGNNVQPQAQPNNTATDNLVARDPQDRQKPLNLALATTGRWEQEGFGRIFVNDPEREGFCEVFFHQGGFSQCLRGQFGTPMAGDNDVGVVTNVSRRLRLIGRGLLGTERKTHGIGAPACFVPYLSVTPVTGPMTDEGIAVKKTDLFSRGQGYVLIDTGLPGEAWEILAHLGPSGEGRLARPRDELGKGILRARFGTQIRPISNASFAYDMPYRYPDRYQPEVEAEALAYLQKSFRMPGAYWRRIEWVERPSRTLRERRCDVVVLARFDGKPEWDAKPTNEPGGLYLFDDENVKEGEVEGFEIDRLADQLEIRVYFRYPSGAFSRLPERQTTDDWKETAILDRLTVEYEKAGVIVRHEEPPY